ncbi:MAG: glycoside hydrolase family 2 protein [Lachnospiraceae bacterium]|nr:glycoside hydrolase family 2 protein [Lachnospiraceae bacterium]
MLSQTLNGNWQLKIIGDNVFGIGENLIPATIPGSVYSALLKNGLMPDPYYRDNELNALKLMDNDFEFSHTFIVSETMLQGDALFLRFDGIDTLADIYLNDVLLGFDGEYSAKNMHRIWEYKVSDVVIAGENHLRVKFYSPVKYIKAKNKEVFAGGSWDAIMGYPHLRKAHCMFGWDWGPRLPDAGIFRDVTLVSYAESRFESVYITQEHFADKVILDFDVAVELLNGDDDYQIDVSVKRPENCEADMTSVSYNIDKAGDGLKVIIPEPKLWWPNGFGGQPLYPVCVKLLDSKGNLLDIWEKRIGLRTMTVNTDADEWGNRFAHEINGVQIFAMGADYIPEDNIFSRITYERTERLLKDAIVANHNIIRIWGGGYYPEDFFFDLCDELGLVVWQDFMYACANYELTEDFEANIIQEKIDNIRRIRHHACLGLWCGNNEMEEQMLTKAWRPSNKQKYDYIKLFEYIIPKILKEEDPQTFYWPSSPSSGGNYDNPKDENRGDAHYWGVWHGSEPLTEFRKHYFRYLSEFGFQSFPGIKTIESFTEPEDRNIFSYIMEMHQRNSAANGKIMNYLSATYRYPTDFECLIYASQLLQAEAMRAGIEHNRRHRGRCMGCVVWQLNDIWPVASWAGIDYFGRWKALHYYEKRAFAPIMISCEEISEATERPYPIAEPAPFEKSARLHIANETRSEVTGTVHWSLRNPDSTVIERIPAKNDTGVTSKQSLMQGCQSVTIPPLDGFWLDKIDFADYSEREMHLNYYFEVEGKAVSSGTCLFTPPKYHHFLDPRLTYSRAGNKLTIKACAYAKNIEISAIDGDVWLSDNYFDMEAGEVTVEIIRGEATEFGLRSVYDIR